MNMEQLFKQAWAQLKQQPVISAVSVAGTALSIFLIMLVVMMQQVKTVPFAPESYRNRFLHVKMSSVTHKAWGSDDSNNGPWSARSLQDIYKPMQTPEAVTIYTYIPIATPVSLPGEPSFVVDMLETDVDFWRVFDFVFRQGKPYDEAVFTAGQPVAVMTESVARRLFGTTDVVGKEFLLAYVVYRVVGVVKDVSTLANTAYAQVWIPYTSTNQVQNTWEDNLMGLMSCTILAKDPADFPAIREEALRRLEAKNKSLEETGYSFINRNRPYTQEKDVLAYGANYEPDVQASRRQRWIIYLILLFVPAINLSSMTQSRLRQRVSEIGVRRAFGATRTELMGQLLGENLIITLSAGLFGLLLSILFAYVGNEFLFAQEFSYIIAPPTVDASILIHYSTFLMALVFCFVLNLLSTGIPAWRASRMKIVDSIGGKLY
ncbi:ABC transporter permease component [gut metagenome]|uniref:ABC transporter permease component n=1 Tax=gut metagenome TaxID=749906 RepID=J9GRW5_9ZZZZ